MRNIKKVFLGLCLISVLVVLLGFGKVNVSATSKETEFNGSKYRVNEVVEENVLFGGIVHTKYNAESSYTKDTKDGYIGQTIAGQYYPQSVNVLEIPNNAEVKVVQWNFQSKVNVEWSLTTVVDMALNYEMLHPGYKVMAAINGDFFDWHSEASYGPLIQTTRGVGVSNGEVIRAMDARGLDNNPLTIGIKNDGSLTNYIQGGKIEFTTNHMLALYDAEGNITEEIEIKTINSVPQDGEVAVYFSYPTGVGEQAKSQGYQLVEMPANNAYLCKQPMRIVPSSNTVLYAKGELAPATETKDLAWGTFGIVTNNQQIRSKIDNAAYVRVQKNVIGDYADCESIGGAVYTMLQDGKEIHSTNPEHHPRTMIGSKADGSIVMATVDGRQTNRNMYGMTADEQGALMEYYGCVNAVNLDGGGSTTILIRNEEGEFEVKNSPSDGGLRRDSNCYLVVMKEAEFSIEEKKVTDSSIEFVLNTSDVNFDKTTAIKCTLNGITKVVENGKVTFDNLTSNTKYEYIFSYDTKDQKDNPTLLKGEISSAKKTPTFGELKVEIVGNKIIFTPNISDPDEALDYYRIFINNIRNPYLGEPIEVKYDVTGLAQFEYKILISYDLNDGKGSVDITEEVVHKLVEDEPIEDTDTGCKKDLSVLVVGMISLSMAGVLIKKREK